MKVYSHEGIIHIVRTVQEKPKKNYHINDLSNLFPDFDLEDDKSHDVSSVVGTYFFQYYFLLSSVYCLIFFLL